ncbi:hypothetical protein FKM82_005869 [Ascaphus truei]
MEQRTIKTGLRQRARVVPILYAAAVPAKDHLNNCTVSKRIGKETDAKIPLLSLKVSENRYTFQYRH